jgi:4-amino-4-deoxy-L-arabinose transferase-like glycosyltransferase
MSQAELWRRGIPMVPQPWSTEPPWPDPPRTFAPLGYRAVGDAIKPTYAVGLPLVMAGMKAIGGQPAIFAIEPLAAAALVLITYGLGRRLGSPRTGLVAALFMATNWTLLSEMTSPMSDVLGGAGLAGAVFFLLRQRPLSVAAAGASAAIAVLVRPNLAPSVVVFVLWIVVEAWKSPRRMRTVALRLAAFGAAVLPGIALPAWANWRLFGSPFESGYGGIRAIFEWSSVPPNLLAYPKYLVETHAFVAFIGVAALVLPLSRLWPGVSSPTRAAIVAFVASVLVPYYFFEPAVHTAYLRYLLGTAPLVMVGAARVIVTLARPRWAAVVMAIGVVASSANSARAVVAYGAFDQRTERRYPIVAGIVRERTPPTSVIFASQHSGSIRYYGGRVTLHHAVLDEAWLDRAIDWLVEHGAHPYALLDEWEVPLFRERFAGQQRVAMLETPLVDYVGGYHVYLFDLAPPVGPPKRAEVIIDTFDNPRFPLPVEMPAFGFRR